MSRRGVLFDPDEARAVAAELARAGWSVEVVREPLAGEDDDEDQSWAVLTDAPEPLLELLVDRYDGWLDPGPDAPGADPPPTVAPLRLPTAPRRPGRRPDPGLGSRP